MGCRAPWESSAELEWGAGSPPDAPSVPTMPRETSEGASDRRSSTRVGTASRTSRATDRQRLARVLSVWCAQIFLRTNERDVVKKKPPRTKLVVETKATSHEEALLARVLDIIETARSHVTRSVNTAMVQAYWLIGREIVEVEQRGEKRADYGARVVEGLAKHLAKRVGKGFSVPNLRNMRQFYLTYPEGSALPAALFGPPGRSEKRSALPSVSTPAKIRSAVPSESGRAMSEGVSVPAPFPPYLGWTHYMMLMRVTNPTARAFYEIEAPSDVLKDPFVIEFLGLDEPTSSSTTGCSVASCSSTSSSAS